MYSSALAWTEPTGTRYISSITEANTRERIRFVCFMELCALRRLRQCAPFLINGAVVGGIHQKYDDQNLFLLLVYQFVPGMSMRMTELVGIS